VFLTGQFPFYGKHYSKGKGAAVQATSRKPTSEVRASARASPSMDAPGFR
jgi:hypothetical protein